MSPREIGFALAVMPGLGPVKFKQIFEHFGSLQEIEAAYKSKQLPEAIQDWLDGGEFLKISKVLQSSAMEYIVLGEEGYPYLLSQVNDPPPVLFFKGDLQRDWEKSISIVGTRSADPQGLELASSFSTAFSENGYTTVSGMAFGVDSAVHRASLADTVAVLASPVDKPTPASNFSLYRNILDRSGLILSEIPPWEKYHKGAHLRRNRIISALTPSTLVIQAAYKSGAINTATSAFNYGRNVYAIPGRATDQLHQGCNRLIKELKASLVTSPEDISSEIFSRQETKLDLLTEEDQLLESLRSRPQNLDEICGRFDRTLADSLLLLSGLELKGCIKLLDDGRYHVKF